MRTLRRQSIMPSLLNEIPLGRLTSVEDVANAVLYLASDEASFLNGVNLPIDGGVTCY